MDVHIDQAGKTGGVGQIERRAGAGSRRYSDDLAVANGNVRARRVSALHRVQELPAMKNNVGGVRSCQDQGERSKQDSWLHKLPPAQYSVGQRSDLYKSLTPRAHGAG